MYRKFYRKKELIYPLKFIEKGGLVLLCLMLVGLIWFLPLAVQAQQYYPAEPTVPSQGSAPEARMKAPDNLLPFPSGVPQVNPPAQPNPLAPTLLTTIEGISFIEDATNNGGFLHIPPDPHGAVGPRHVVSVVNVSIEWHTKTGTQQNSQSLSSFFTSLSPQSLFDPKVLYDQFANRFVVVVLDQTSVPADPANTSRILLAVSDDNDPNGTWYFHEIPSVFALSGSDSAWTDYPGFAVDEEAVYVTGNLFSFNTGSPSGSRLWIINKTPFYSGGAASVNVYDPATAVGQSAATMQPAHIYGTAPVGVGTWLVRYSAFTDGTNEFLSIIRVDNPLGTPSFSHQFVNLGDIDNTAAVMPDAPQSGTGTLIDTGDRRALDAVWRNNSLYTCASVVPGSGSDAGQATAHWWQVNTTTITSLTLTDQGNIGGEDIATGAYTFYPSVAVDQNDNLAIGFAASASSIFPGAYYTGRLSTDPAGTLQSSGTLAAGLDFYVRTFGGSRNRWGDYSAISIDPTDDLTFWVFNEYALTRGNPTGSEDGQWGNRWGRFKLNQQSVNPGDIIITEIMQNPSAVADGNGEWVELYNNTASAIDIDGWTLRDNGTDSHVINNSGPLLVPANGFVVLGIDSNSTTNGNYTADYQYSNFVLDNTSDEVILENLTGTVIDSVAYDGGVTFPNPNGASMALTVFIADNSVGSNWTTSTVREPSFVGSTGDLGSPGTLGSDQTLPVELAAFTVTAGDKEVVLNWVTESETENLGFKILRASREDGEYTLLSSYETNPDLEGQLTSNTKTEYSFRDGLVLNGVTYWYKLVDVDIFGIHTEHGPLVATPQSGGGNVTTLSANAPKKFKLYPNFPNPFNPETTLQVDIPALSNQVRVEVTVYNTLGQKVRTIFNGALAPGTHALKWRGIDDNGNHVPSGVYFAQIKAARLHQVVKMILLK